jgi:hypothetical protein
MLLVVVTSRFNDAPPDLTEKIRHIEERNTLHKLYESASTCENLGAFEEELDKSLAIAQA